jgi:hypothetical protein
MPNYDYHCAANGRTLEVKHRMSETVATWGELCALAGIATEHTPLDSPVAKVLSATFVAAGGQTGDKASAPAPSGHRHTAMCQH